MLSQRSSKSLWSLRRVPRLRIGSKPSIRRRLTDNATEKPRCLLRAFHITPPFVLTVTTLRYFRQPSLALLPSIYFPDRDKVFLKQIRRGNGHDRISLKNAFSKWIENELKSWRLARNGNINNNNNAFAFESKFRFQQPLTGKMSLWKFYELNSVHRDGGEVITPRCNSPRSSPDRTLIPDLNSLAFLVPQSPPSTILCL